MYVLVTSPRVAPGLMTLSAWELLRGADRVVCLDPDDPTAQAVRSAGLDVEVGADATVGARGSHPATVWLAPVGDETWAERLAQDVAERGEDTAAVEVVFGSYDLPGARLLDLVDVMDRLRRECPWTREQTHESLGRYLLEESYEVLEALDRGDHGELREELGDVLMQVAFHAAVAQSHEVDSWSIDDVAASIVTKLVDRNPHVFGDVEVGSAADVDANWRAIKATEKSRSSPLEGIPETLPALAYADKVLDRLQGDAEPLAAADLPGTADIGHRLLALVREAREQGVDAEAALRRVVRGLGE